MCGRYTIAANADKLLERFQGSIMDADLKLPRFNVAPSQAVPVLYSESGKKQLSLFRWGLIPSWSKDAAIGNKMINARIETLSEKRSFNRLLKTKRCLVVADGFYEWVKEGPAKIPMRVHLKTNALFTFAGLWDKWQDSGGLQIPSFTIITTEAKGNAVMEPIHHRMPVIMKKSDEEEWLRTVDPMPLLERLLQTYPAEEMNSYPVSKFVNSPKNDSPQCIVQAG